ncbi:hypothetical protein A9P82_07065 [Arachidicoccus ginsenosidimutans]|uniref:hypothetical protein n=1 Tax=Arachidicoccus sp. BS20 TaxID=1850526 RepID=UPI0007F0B91E|nr:hypothetical protein [Arachidicoccus sp. BS20]ANI89069.1 hypothetical protein A9P82_07065 [Arachidicoccus sp. BS20]
MLKNILFLSIFSFIIIQGFSQEILPDFTIKKGAQNQKVISWRNNFGDMISVLNIQRSNDSVRNFRTLYSVPNATLQVNAYTDTKPVPGMDYYRIYYTFKNGSYYFTKAKKLTTGFLSAGLLGNLSNYKNIIIQGEESRTLALNDFKRMSDSVLNNTSDSLFYSGDSTVMYKKFNAVAAIAAASPKAPVTSVSGYMYVNEDGSIVIHLPENDVYDYSMTIYQPDGNSVLYKISHFDSPEIILSKSSFMRAGFYPYELYKDGKLTERNRFQIK